MLAKQVSRDKEIFCTAEMSLTEVFKKMNELNCVCMPIVESPNHRNIIGTVTEHDICRRLIDGGLNPQRATAGRVMSGDFTTVGGETSLDNCLLLCRYHHRLVHEGSWTIGWDDARRPIFFDPRGQMHYEGRWQPPSIAADELSRLIDGRMVGERVAPTTTGTS